MQNLMPHVILSESPMFFDILPRERQGDGENPVPARSKQHIDIQLLIKNLSQ